MNELIGRLLGYDDVRSIDRFELSWAAPWVQGRLTWLFLGCAALCALAVWFYTVRQRGKGRGWLAVMRAVLLTLIFLILAEPILVTRWTTSPRPLLWLVVDGTDSMAIVDELSEGEQARLARAVGLADRMSLRKQDVPPSPARAAKPLSRMDYVQALWRRKSSNLLEQLAEKFRLKAFVFDRPDGVRAIDLESPGGRKLDPAAAARQLTTEGQVTALGSALNDLARRHSSGALAGVLLVSDFNQNAGPPALAAARKLGVPIYTVGVGPETAVDLAVDLSAPLMMKKAERSVLVATLRQNGLDGQTARLKLTARRLGTADDAPTIVVGERDVPLSGVSQSEDFSYTPDEPGRYLFFAEAAALQGEVVDQNNRAEREVSIRDDFLRLMFVEYEPTWEWRFIKEVFHRDKLVGMRGFRTFLRSADPKVRETNELFLQTLAPQRSEFFANDVIFLGDMPAATLSTRFCEMTKEFVGKFGGGLVVLAGPRFGPGQLAETPLADMLPVVVDPDGRLRDEREFDLRLSAEAEQFDFMRLGASATESKRAWDNLGRLPWYQPVSRVHPLATVLADHPADTCVDGRTPQPLVAVRRYGRGEVVYLGFDETWRLRRKFGELYYRQFWGQMIHRLGLSHAPGTQKRFVVKTDRQHYQADDKVLVTVEAYDAQFEPLAEEKLPERRLSAELLLPDGAAAAGDRVRKLSVPQAREGLFEARIAVVHGGEHLVRVKDPVTSEFQEVRFQVTSVSAERRSAVRNVALQRELAQVTGGRTYDLATVSRLVDEVDRPRRTESRIDVFPLWNTWLCFGLAVTLMLGEWLTRKLVNLP